MSYSIREKTDMQVLTRSTYKKHKVRDMQWSPALKIGTAWRVESGTQGVRVGGAKRPGEGRFSFSK